MIKCVFGGHNWDWALVQLKNNNRVSRKAWKMNSNVFNTKLLWVEWVPIGGLSWAILRNGKIEMLLQPVTDTQKAATDWDLFMEFFA